MSQFYEGDVTAGECWTALGREPDAFLIDVRSQAEWTYVGVPVLGPDARPPLFQEWQSFPSMAVDPRFAETLAARIAAQGGGPQSRLYFLCRSGVRSMASAAALTMAGFGHCFNVLGGFEGPPDEAGHRGTTAGWKAEGLPWAQR